MLGTAFLLGREVVRISKRVIQIRKSSILNDGSQKNPFANYLGVLLEKCPNARDDNCTWTGGRTNFKKGHANS